MKYVKYIKICFKMENKFSTHIITFWQYYQGNKKPVSLACIHDYISATTMEFSEIFFAESPKLFGQSP